MTCFLTAETSGNQKRFLARSCEAVPQATEWQRIGDQIDAVMIFARAHFVNVVVS
jgi:hypothetical protein